MHRFRLYLYHDLKATKKRISPSCPNVDPRLADDPFQVGTFIDRAVFLSYSAASIFLRSSQSHPSTGVASALGATRHRKKTMPWRWAKPSLYTTLSFEHSYLSRSRQPIPTSDVVSYSDIRVSCLHPLQPLFHLFCFFVALFFFLSFLFASRSRRVAAILSSSWLSSIHRTKAQTICW